MSDPDWYGGNYYATGRFPHRGLKLARLVRPSPLIRLFAGKVCWLCNTHPNTFTFYQVSQIAYRSGPEWQQRFGYVEWCP